MHINNERDRNPSLITKNSRSTIGQWQPLNPSFNSKINSHPPNPPKIPQNSKRHARSCASTWENSWSSWHSWHGFLRPWDPSAPPFMSSTSPLHEALHVIITFLLLVGHREKLERRLEKGSKGEAEAGLCWARPKDVLGITTTTIKWEPHTPRWRMTFFKNHIPLMIQSRCSLHLFLGIFFQI